MKCLPPPSRNLGAPYKGSKSKIAREIVDILPPNEVFVDLFAGGCAVTHAAILSGKFERYLVNDMEGLGVRAFLMGIRGEFRNESRFISRDDFQALKASDPYAALCFSFGNNLKTYLYRPEIEQLKSVACRMILEPERKKRRLLFRQFITVLGLISPDVWRENLKCLSGLEALTRLERLESLGSLLHSDSVIQASFLDYREVKIPPCATVYADPPYKGTEGYNVSFNHDEFWEWVRTREYPVYVSEYQAPGDFKAIWQKEKTCSYARENTLKTLEKLFIHQRWS